jgi:hypothetical protein
VDVEAESLIASLLAGRRKGRSMAHAKRRSTSTSGAHAGRDNRGESEEPGLQAYGNTSPDGQTVAEEQYQTHTRRDDRDLSEEPDVLLDIPVLKVGSIHIEVDDLDAHVALLAEVLDLVKLNVGVDAHLANVAVDIEGVEAQALLKVRLHHIAAIVGRVLTSVDRNPELLAGLGRTVESLGTGAGHTLGHIGVAVEDVGKGTHGCL